MYQERRLEILEHEKRQIQKVLRLKRLKGSIVWEKVNCRTPPRSCCPHGPYAYLHYYDVRSGKVKRKYLGKNVELLSLFKGELEQRLREIEAEEREILGTSLTREKTVTRKVLKVTKNTEERGLVDDALPGRPQNSHQ